MTCDRRWLTGEEHGPGLCITRKTLEDSSGKGSNPLEFQNLIEATVYHFHINTRFIPSIPDAKNPLSINMLLLT